MVVAPTGGSKDTYAPNLVSVSTPVGETNFDKKKVVFLFDEYIQLSNPLQQIVISPAMEILPDFEVSGKSLIMRLRDTLRTNTTYTINFGNAIIDVHEQNPLSNFTYTFSTGSYIDSLVVSGRCYNSFNLAAEADLLVGLYHVEEFRDSSLYNKKPDYFTKSGVDGSFKIKNLPVGSFYLFSFKDANRNLKYDLNEAVGFYPNIIQTLDSTNDLIKISTFFQDAFKSNTLLDTLSPFAGLYTLVFFKPNQIKLLNNEDKVSYLFNKTGEKSFDSIFIFVPDTSTRPSFSIITPDTSYKLSFKKSKNSRYPLFTYDVPRMVELNDTLRISFSNPLHKRIDTSLIVLKEDTTVVKYSYVYYPEKGFLGIVYPWKESNKYSIIFKDSCLYDIFNQPLKKQQSSWTSKNIKDYASLELNIKGTGSGNNCLIEIWTEDEKKILYRFIVYQNTIIRLSEVIPGVVKIKLIDDKNKNGVWDNGDVFNRIEPEVVGYIKDKVVLRAYWDLELLIDVQQILK
jgi:hypothetical protein